MRKEYLHAVMITTGATFVAEELEITLGLVTLDMLGTVERIVVANEKTTIVTDGSNEEAIEMLIT